ncbi:MAG: hypothetical protein AAGJ87_08645 [Pseudomonadota bacterium]
MQSHLGEMGRINYITLYQYPVSTDGVSDAPIIAAVFLGGLGVLVAAGLLNWINNAFERRAYGQRSAEEPLLIRPVSRLAIGAMFVAAAFCAKAYGDGRFERQAAFEHRIASGETVAIEGRVENPIIETTEVSTGRVAAHRTAAIYTAFEVNGQVFRQVKNFRRRDLLFYDLSDPPFADGDRLRVTLLEDRLVKLEKRVASRPDAQRH